MGIRAYPHTKILNLLYAGTFLESIVKIHLLVSYYLVQSKPMVLMLERGIILCVAPLSTMQLWIIKPSVSREMNNTGTFLP